MLTGKRPFGGDDVTDTIASIVKDEPEWRLLPANLPPAIVSLLHRCLQKDARRRLRDIGDARVDIADVIEGKGPSGPVVPVSPARPARLPWVAAIVVAALVGAASTWLVMRQPTSATSPSPTVRFALQPPPGVLHISNVALADDASFVVYTGSTDKDTSLFVHRFDDGTVQPVRGTSGARWPFLSPDGKWVGFFRAGRIQKVSLAGGDALTLCEANGGPGAVWLPDGRIIFAGSWLSGLFSVSAEGGKPTPLTTLDASKGEKGHWWPARLPDGRLLFTVFMAGAGLNDNRVAVFDAASGRHQSLFAGVKASWLASGHLLFYRAGRYQVVPFDLKTAHTSGDAVVVLEDATELDPAGDWPQPVVVSASGTLAYLPGQYVPESRLIWISPSGATTAVPLPVRPYVGLALSPRGDQAALATLEGGRLSLRLADLARGIDTSLDLDGMSWNPTWHPDGRRLAFTSMRKGDFDVFLKDVTAADRETPVVDDGMDSTPSDVDPGRPSDLPGVRCGWGLPAAHDRSSFAGHEDAADRFRRRAQCFDFARWPMAGVCHDAGRPLERVCPAFSRGRPGRASLSGVCRQSVLSAAGSRALPAARSAGDRHVVGREGRPIRNDRGTHSRHRSLGDHDVRTRTSSSRPMGEFSRWQRPRSLRLRGSTSSSTGPRAWENVKDDSAGGCQP